MDKQIAPHQDNSLRFVIVTNSEQLLHAQAVRSICFLEETGLPAHFVFDGNDFQATHMVAYAGAEPIGAIRIRWFKDFAKIERTALRKAYRDPRILKRCAEFVFEHAARKGYAKVLTLAKPEFAAIWIRMLGFRKLTGQACVLAADGESYFELVKDVAPAKQAITIQTDPNVLLQVEGHWRFAETLNAEDAA